MTHILPCHTGESIQGAFPAADISWKETFVFFPKRDHYTGEKISGIVMTATENGTRIWRSMTKREAIEYISNEGW